MRTTLELPDSLFKRTKIAAVERGMTFKELVGIALERELREPAPAKKPAKKLTFPLIPSKRPGSLHLTNADIARMEEEEDFRRHGLTR
jgi:hypothetical protein